MNERLTAKQRIKREYNQRFWDKKRKAGWRVFSFILPPGIGEELLALKQTRMTEYRRRTLEEKE